MSLQGRVGVGIILLFALAGAYMLSIVFHEVSHREDFAGFNPEREAFCFLYSSDGTIGTALNPITNEIWGYYYHELPMGFNKTIELEVAQKTDMKAVRVQWAVLIIFVIALYFAHKDLKEIQRQLSQKSRNYRNRRNKRFK
jgi:hypothetical protein